MPLLTDLGSAAEGIGFGIFGVNVRRRLAEWERRLRAGMGFHSDPGLFRCLGYKMLLLRFSESE